MRFVFALFVVGLGACTPKESSPLPPPPRAVAAANALKSELKAALEAAMQNGGPENAIDVCKDKAQAIAAAHSKDGLVVGRTSHKLRNVANAPRAWVQLRAARTAQASTAQVRRSSRRQPRSRHAGRSDGARVAARAVAGGAESTPVPGGAGP